MRTTYHRAIVALAALVSTACQAPTPPAAALARDADADLHRRPQRTLSPALCALDRRDFTLDPDNEFFPLSAGSRWSYRGREDGTAVALRITVLDETEQVGGVRTRVVEEREWEDGELLEVSRNFFAGTAEGTVCYFGEEVDIYENGRIVSHEGAWRADTPPNAPGIMMPGDPRVGMRYQMERAPGIAEDAATIVRAGSVKVPAGRFREALFVEESALGAGSPSRKVYAADVGLVVDGPLQLESWRIAGRRGERDDD